MYMNFQRKLPIPQEVKQEFPLSEAMVAVKAERDRQIREVFEGKSITDPCLGWEKTEKLILDIADKL